MKKVLFFICYVIGFIIGALLLIFNAETLQKDQTMIRYAMMAAGVVFIIPALIQLISSLSPKKDEFGNILPRKWYTTVVAVLALLWGIYILIWPTGYNDSLSITLGVSLILAGLAQAVWIVRTAESTFVRFIVPVITLVAGVAIIIFLKDTTGSGKADLVAAIISGIVLIVWCVNGIFSLRSKRVVAAADKAAKTERKAEKEERKALKEQAKELVKGKNETSGKADEAAHSEESESDTPKSPQPAADKTETTEKPTKEEKESEDSGAVAK